MSPFKEKDHGKALSELGETLYFLREADRRLSGISLKNGHYTTAYRVPRWILFPVLAAFRANVDWDLAKGRFEWLVPVDELIDPMLDDCMSTFVHDIAKGGQKDAIGNDRKVYHICYRSVVTLMLKHMR